MTTLIHTIPGLFASLTGSLVQDGHAEAGHAAAQVGHAVSHGIATPVEGPLWIALIPLLPIVGLLLATFSAIFKVKSKLPAFLTVGCLAGAFGVAVGAYQHLSGMAPGSTMVLYGQEEPVVVQDEEQDKVVAQARRDARRSSVAHPR